MSLQGLILSPEAILLDVKARSVRSLLQVMSECAAQLVNISPKHIFEQVWQRELQGSTSVGHGVALPHCYSKKLPYSFITMAKLETPLYFTDTDYLPTDLVFLLVSPTGQEAVHLQALAKIARLARNNDFLTPLRSIRERASMYNFLCSGAYSLCV